MPFENFEFFSTPENQEQQKQGQETPPQENPQPAGGPTYPGFHPSFTPYLPYPVLTWQPPIDIFEDHENILIVIEIPGVKPEQIYVESTPGLLVIRGEIPPVESQMVPRYRERNIRGFLRQIPLPPQANPDQAEAFYQNGLLEIKIPKETPRGQRIDVKH